ncbi:hypothetical protein AB0F30_16690 [Streptomyces sp. NPDC029006]|uniref:hypothetical protein n=1 Tax=Streptomyces sp. NPDC029006 TaxID=3155467 RepID=UPI0033C4FE6A
MSLTLHPKAQTGRRIIFSRINDPKPIKGVVTGTQTAANGVALVRIRLDGQRSNLAIPADFAGLHYLSEIGPVPELPMGRFQPTTKDPGFDYQYDGVLLVEFEEGDLAVLTTDRDKAEAAVATYLREQHGMEDETEISEELAELTPRWVVFEWEPEDAECAWLMNPAKQGDDQALQVHYLPQA